MIDPNNITNFKRTTAELEEFLMFSIMVAGKSSKTTAKKLQEFLADKPDGLSPFEYLDELEKVETDGIEKALKKHKTGQYGRISNAFRQILRFDKDRLKTASIQSLEAVRGIGPKTSRFFLVHSRPNQNFAVLDVHILRWLNKHCNIYCRYTQTPPITAYRVMEKTFLYIASVLKMTSAALDLEIWNNKENEANLAALHDRYLRMKHKQKANELIEKVSTLFKPANAV